MLLDLHNDFLTELDENSYEKYLQNCEQNLCQICAPIWTTNLGKPINYISSKINKICSLYLKQKPYVCLEDLGFVTNFDILTNWQFLYCGLCWNNSNKYCGGAYGTGKITSKGKKLVSFLQESNIIVDCAHMNKCSFNDYVNISKKPIFCSHTGFYDIVKDKRNLEKSQIDLIVSSGGLVGLYFVGKYISQNKCNSDEIVKNILYFVENYGTKNLAIGSDFYGTDDLPEDINSYADFDIIKQKLLKNGIKEDEIVDIFYKNAFSFIKNNCNKKEVG